MGQMKFPWARRGPMGLDARKANSPIRAMYGRAEHKSQLGLRVCASAAVLPGGEDSKAVNSDRLMVTSPALRGDRPAEITVKRRLTAYGASIY